MSSCYQNNGSRISAEGLTGSVSENQLSAWLFLQSVKCEEVLGFLIIIIV